jgi:hypothetical protein
MNPHGTSEYAYVACFVKLLMHYDIWFAGLSSDRKSYLNFIM